MLLAFSTQQTEIFSYKHTPDVPVADAIRVSMSIPLVFKPHQPMKKDKSNKTELIEDFYVDGGINDNYPIWLFDEITHNNGVTEEKVNCEYDTPQKLDSALRYKLH